MLESQLIAVADVPLRRKKDARLKIQRKYTQNHKKLLENITIKKDIFIKDRSKLKSLQPASVELRKRSKQQNKMLCFSACAIFFLLQKLCIRKETLHKSPFFSAHRALVLFMKQKKLVVRRFHTPLMATHFSKTRAHRKASQRAEEKKFKTIFSCEKKSEEHFATFWWRLSKIHNHFHCHLCMACVCPWRAHLLNCLAYDVLMWSAVSIKQIRELHRLAFFLCGKVFFRSALFGFPLFWRFLHKISIDRSSVRFIKRFRSPS